MTKKVKEQKIKTVWTELWAKYKKEWTEAWNKYKTLVGPFIKGTASYIWLLISNLLEIVKTGLFETGRILVEYIISWFNKI